MISFGEYKSILYIPKYNFVIRCHVDRNARNFPTANLLETALLEFDIAVRDYQREVPDTVKQCQREDIEGYTLPVEDIRKQNSISVPQESSGSK